jgi:UDP-glucose:(heptosyl)LPS alpha-1,3-glucosyltransferase
MRVALISRVFDTAGGGTERDLLVTAQILAAAGHQVTIYATQIRSQHQGLEVRCVAVPPLGRAIGLFWFATRVARIARHEGAELVLSFARIVGADILRSGGSAHSSYVRAARRWQSIAAAAAMHLSPYHRVQIAIERAGYASPGLRLVIAVSEFVRRDLLATFSLNPAKVISLYNGVDLERLVPNRDPLLRNAIRREFKIPPGVPAVAFVGNGFARKGLGYLLEAWTLAEPHSCLIVAGTDRLLNSYRRRVRELGLQGRVIFTGASACVARLFKAVDGVALPSLFEPFGNVILEAMAAGLPVLCSKACGAAEIVPRELSELVVEDPANIGELVRQVNLLLRIGDVALPARSTAEHYTWELYGTELLRLITSEARLCA